MPRTYAGRDLQAAVMGDPSSNASGAFAPANWMALSTNGDAESPTATSLPGEVTGGTLARAQCTYSHTNGTASYTLIRTWVSDRDVTVRKYGIYNAETGGTLMWEKLLPEPVTLKSGDSMQIVHTVSI